MEESIPALPRVARKRSLGLIGPACFFAILTGVPLAQSVQEFKAGTIYLPVVFHRQIVDSVAPSPPTLVGSAPASPNQSTTPVINGTSELPK